MKHLAKHLDRKTFCLKQSELKSSFTLLDVAGITLGRAACHIAHLLKGKDRVDYTPHTSCGSHVIVINFNKIVLTGKKLKNKTYIHHTGWMGGLKEIKYIDLIKKHPFEPLKLAVKRMLNKNRTRDELMSRLHIFADDQHTYHHLLGGKK